MIKIVNERGTIQQGRNGAVIKWNNDYMARQQRNFDKIQVFIDNTVVRHMDPYVPLRTSMLKKSVILGSVMGSGLLTYIAPYAHKQYYLKSRRYTNGLRGSRWFHRMYSARKPQIIREVKNYARSVMR